MSRPIKRFPKTAEEEAESAAELLDVTKVVNRPGIPVAFPGTTMAGNSHWQVWWWSGAAVLVLLFMFTCHAWHHRETFNLDPNASYDLNFNVQGCDINFQNVEGENEVLVRYWKRFTSSSVDLSTSSLTVNATSSAKWSSFRCAISVRASSAKIGHINLNLSPDAASAQSPNPTNTKGLVYISFGPNWRADSVSITSSVFTQVSFARSATISESLDASLTAGGTMGCNFQHAPKQTSIAGERVQYTIETESNLDISLDEASKEWAVVSGRTVTPCGKDCSYMALSGADGGSTCKVSIAGTSIASYFAANAGQSVNSLHTVRGSGQSTPGLMPSGTAALIALKMWLTQSNPAPSRYMLYIQYVAPHASSGTLRILSAKAYLAFTLEFFALISAGMMSPTVVWTQLDMVGLERAWPHDAGNVYRHTPKSQEAYARVLWDLTRPILTPDSFTTTSVVVWKPHSAEWFGDGSDDSLVIEKAHTKLSGGWVVRPIAFADKSSFILASALTLVLGASVGISLCWVFYSFVLPGILKKIREDSISDGASFKLTQVMEASAWSVTPAMIQYPESGMLLRWKTPVQQILFATLDIEARRWPLLAGPSCKIKGIDAGRVPMFPGVPGQFAFLFGSEQGVIKPKVFDTLFDNELQAHVMTFQAKPQAMQSGHAYQFQIKAKGATGVKIARSAWSNPTHVVQKRAFVDYPLILMKTAINMLPSDTWALFLNRYTKVDGLNLLTLTFKNIKIAVKSESPLVLKDALTYGDSESKAVVLNVVDQSLSLENKKCIAEVELNGPAVPFADLQTIYTKTNQQAPEGLEGKDITYKVCECKSADFLSLGFMGNAAKTITIDLSPMKTMNGVEAESAPAASLVPDWGELFHTGSHRLPIILRYGVEAVALVMADMEFKNPRMPNMQQEKFHCLEQGLIGKDTEDTKKGNCMLHNLIPGYTFVWGETLTISWDRKAWPIKPLKKIWSGSDKGKDSFNFDIFMCARQHPDHAGKQNEPMRHKIGSAVRIAPGGPPALPIMMSHYLSKDVTMAHCYLELEYHSPEVTRSQGSAPPSDANKLWYRSPEFMIIRPTMLQDLELGYASWCVQNKMPMQPMNPRNLAALGVVYKPVTLRTAKDYRDSLPWEVYDPSAINTIINYEGCTLIHDGPVLNVDSKSVKDDDWASPSDDAPDAADDSEAPAAARKKPTLLRIPTTSLELDVPVNCFWDWKSDWSSELLLYYKVAPSIGYSVGVTGLVGTPTKKVHYMCMAIRATLKTLIFFLQAFCLCLPACLVLMFWILHDVITSNTSAGLGFHEYIEDFVVSPSLSNWNSLDKFGHYVFLFFIGYCSFILVGIYVCNFLTKDTGGGRFRKWVDTIVGLMTTLMLFLFITYLGIVGVWCFMGAIVEPQVMMPYAIMMLALYFVITSCWKKMSDTMHSVLDRVGTEVDNVLHTLTFVFLESVGLAPPGMLEQIDMGAAILCQSGVIAAEAEDDKKLEAAALGVKNDVEQAALGIAEFRVKAVGSETLATDFIAVAADYSALRQATGDAAKPTLLEAAQTAAITAGLATNSLKYTETGVLCKPTIEVGHIYQGILDRAMKGTALMASSTPSEDAELQEIASKMQLHPDTAKQMRDAFMHAIASDTIAPPVIGPGDFHEIRYSQLFAHFLERNGQTDVKRFLSEVQQVDMELFDGKTASSMTQRVNWVSISSEGGSFIQEAIFTQVVMRAVNKQMDETYAGSAASSVSSVFFKTGAEQATRKTYAVKEEARIFLDAGVVTEEYFNRPECRAILDGAINLKRDPIGGGLAPSAIVAAARALVLFDSTSTDILRKYYLWFDGMKAILQAAGWTEGEMDEAWLKMKWETLTGGTGLYQFALLSDLQLMVSSLTNGRLWRTATKAVLFKTKVYGMAGCDAQQCKDLLLANNPQDFMTLKEKVQWPAWIDEIYTGIAETAKHEESGPKFLDPLKMIRFMKKLVYDDDDDSKDTIDTKDPNGLLMLNGLPEDIMDMQWRFGDETEAKQKSLWHVLAGKKDPLRIRGLWLEAALDILGRTESVPSDIDFFFDAWEQQDAWEPLNADGSQTLQYMSLKRWVIEIYLVRVTALTVKQFDMIVNDKLKVGIPESHLEEVFTACPLVVGDDNMVLRNIADLGWGLKLWMGAGLWKRACHQLAESLMPPGGMKTLALAELDTQFDLLDEAASLGGEPRGVIQVPQVFYLMKKICHLGLTCDELNAWVSSELGMEIPEADMQQAFNFMDANGDGALSWQEFVPAMRFLLTSYIPKVILDRMGLTRGKILMFVLVIGLNLAAIYLFISLVFVAFTTGEGIASAMHSAMSAGAGAVQQVKSQAGGGGGSSGGLASSAEDYAKQLATSIKETIILSLGLSKTVADRLIGLAEGTATSK